MKTISLLAFALLLSVAHSRIGQPRLLNALGARDAGTVTIQTLNSTILQATFSHNPLNLASAETVKEGVHIESEVNEDIERVKIQKLNGEAIVSYYHDQNQKATLLNIKGKSFISIQNTHGRFEYEVADAFTQEIEGIFSQGNFIPEYLPLFASRGASAKRVAAFQELLAGHEIPLMRAAVEAIGTRGIIGRDSPPALPVMAMITRWSSLRDDHLGNVKRTASKKSWWNPFVSKPSDCKVQTGEIRCSNDPAVSNGACCKSRDICPTGEDDYCNGMCGYSCDCWKFLCGDCCVHKGCLGHDKCCRDGGMIAFGCMLPTTFRCEEPYSCT